jgi:hypothetical protein
MLSPSQALEMWAGFTIAGCFAKANEIVYKSRVETSICNEWSYCLYVLTISINQIISEEPLSYF